MNDMPALAENHYSQDFLGYQALHSQRYGLVSGIEYLEGRLSKDYKRMSRGSSNVSSIAAKVVEQRQTINELHKLLNAVHEAIAKKAQARDTLMYKVLRNGRSATEVREELEKDRDPVFCRVIYALGDLHIRWAINEMFEEYGWEL